MKKGFAIIALILNQFFAANGDLWCHFHHNDTHLDHHIEVHADEFPASIFLAYGNEENCTISKSGLESLAADLVIGEDSHSHDHDHDHGHTHGVNLLHMSKKSLQMLKGRNIHDSSDGIDNSLQQIARSRFMDEDHDHGTEVSHTCYTVDDLLHIFNLTEEAENGLTKEQFESMCPALLQQHLQGCVAHEESVSSTRPTNWEMYGLGTLSVFVLSISSLLGLVVYRWRDSPAYNYIICTMLGLSVGALVGDAILHLGPQAMGLHDHSADGGHDHDHGEGVVIEDYVWKMVVCLGAMWGFFMLQMGLEYGNHKSGGHGHSHGPVKEVRLNKIENGTANPGFTDSNGNVRNLDANHEKSDHSKYHEKQLDEKQNADTATITDKAVAWMVMVGDSVHNFADGMTIGASFAVDWKTGMATSIAVLCHELPHEFGDIAALLASGWPVKKVALVNFISACVAFVGLYIGIPLATALDAEAWVLATAMGMFLYVGLGNIVPELMENFKRNPSIKLAVASNAGIFFGFLVMFLIAIFEDQITF